MTTGVDAQTCKLIVLDQRIESMTRFKQIIGRGSRIREDLGKLFFTILDFKKATELFADPDFDGEPVQIYCPKGDDSPVPPDTDTGEGTPVDTVEPGEDENEQTVEGVRIGKSKLGAKRRKYYINDVEVFVVSERVQYYDKDGKLITESLKDYTRNTVNKEFASLDEFISHWSAADKKQAIIEELKEQGVILEALEDEVGKEYDPFDLICHVAFGQPPLTRRERAEHVKKRNYFAKYGEKAQTVLSALLDKYADEGIDNLEDVNVLKVQPFTQIGTIVEIITGIFGGKDQYLQALRELERELYQAA